MLETPCNENQLVVGGIYRTEETISLRFDNEEEKPRWFVYLGNTGILSSPVFVYVFTSTTQLWHFEEGGDKANSPHLKFKTGEFGFTSDCVICFDDVIDTLTEKSFKDLKPVHKGDFDLQTLRQIYEKILESKRVTRLIKLQIHDALNNIGITNLPKPPARHR